MTKLGGIDMTKLKNKKIEERDSIKDDGKYTPDPDSMIQI